MKVMLALLELDIKASALFLISWANECCPAAA